MITDNDIKEISKDARRMETEGKKVFDSIHHKITRKQPLSQMEREFFCKNLFDLNIFGRAPFDWKSFEFCESSNEIFKSLYLQYWHDHNGVKEHRNAVGNIIAPTEKIFHVEYLKKVADNWKRLISDKRHPDQIFLKIAKETTDEIKKFNKKPIFRPYGYLVQNFYYKGQLRKLLLRSKYIFLITTEIFEEYGSPVILSLNGFQIELDEVSLNHILNRHYAFAEKQIEENKSFHTKLIPPRKLIELLKKIFEKIEKSNLYNGEPVNRINFVYNDQPFGIWINKRNKQVAGRGNVEFFRLKTFFPIGWEKELNQIKSETDLITIDDELSVFI